MRMVSSTGVAARGGGNQLRQPYMKAYFGKDRGTEFPVTDHIHFYGMYIGNFPDLSAAEVTEIVDIVNSAV